MRVRPMALAATQGSIAGLLVLCLGGAARAAPAGAAFAEPPPEGTTETLPAGSTPAAEQAQGQPSAEELQAVADQVQRLGGPGPEHQLLGKLAGAWSQEVRYWLSPGGEAMVAAGTGRNELILGGRFLTMAAAAGEGPMHTESLTILGFDRRGGRYTLVGYDTWGTYYITGEGLYDGATRTLTLAGANRHPASGRTEEYDITFRWAGDDEVVQAVVFKLPDGGTYKAAEITWRRAR